MKQSYANVVFAGFFCLEFDSKHVGNSILDLSLLV